MAKRQTRNDGDNYYADDDRDNHRAVHRLCPVVMIRLRFGWCTLHAALIL
jgi:hypothetical protein